MNKKTKIAISAIMSLGLLAAGCSIGKMIADMHIGPDICMFFTTPIFFCLILLTTTLQMIQSLFSFARFSKKRSVLFALLCPRCDSSTRLSKPGGMAQASHKASQMATHIMATVSGVIQCGHRLSVKMRKSLRLLRRVLGPRQHASHKMMSRSS